MFQLASVLKWLDQNIEKSFIMVTFPIMFMIIFVEVVRRFFFSVQAAWSTSIPIYMYLYLTWIGAAYNVKKRSHLTFGGIRIKLKYKNQYLCLCLDFICWIFLSTYVLISSTEQVLISYDNFAFVPGTSLSLWYFYAATPVGWVLIVYRLIRNIIEDTQNYRQGLPLLPQPTVEEIS